VKQLDQISIVEVDQFCIVGNTWGRPETSGTRAAINSGYDLGKVGEWYLHGGFADTDGRYRFFYRAPGHSTLVNVTTLPAGYTPYLDGAQRDLSLVTGLKGETDNELTYNFSVGFGKNELDYFLNNTVNASLVSNGSPGQRDFDMGGYEQEEVNFNADFGMPLSDSMYLGFGAEWREESFTTIAGEPNAYFGSGTSGLAAATPQQAGELKRDNYAVYGDLEVDVTDDLLLQGALRYEDFSDFGDTINGKFAARYNISDDIVIRGALSTGFHAPTPGQTNITTVTTTFTGTTQIDEGLLRVTNPTAIANGAKPLKEEESTSLSGGITFSMSNKANLAIDFYQTEVDDRIYRTGNIETDNGIISFYTNALDVEHQGIDLVYTNSIDWDNAETKLTFAYNYNTIEVVGQSMVNGEFPVGDGIIEDIENNYPEHRFVATSVTDFADYFQFMARLNYYGEHYDERGRINGVDGNAPTAQIDGVFYVDMELNFFATEGLTLTLGASNIFDEYVDEIGEPNANRISVGLQYPRRTPANYEGGSWYLRAKYQF
jgi:iron complex outermembrane receptor protein